MAQSGNPVRIVVYGGIGSGKSTAAALLADKGAVVIEADRIGHEILIPGGAAFSAVSGRWPDVVVDGADGAEIDRKALGAIVFAEAAALEELESLTHPAIVAEIHRRVDAAGALPVVLEMPLVRPLVGDGWTWVLIDAPAELRLERAVARGATEEDIAARMAAQPGDLEWHAKADWIVPNTGTLGDLANAIDELWAELAPLA